jgi:hypothetical protein
MMNKSKIISTVVGLLFAVILVFPWIRFWQIDKCLDQGGSWNKEQSCCATVEDICKSIDVTEWPFWGWIWLSVPPLLIGLATGLVTHYFTRKMQLNL